MRLAYADPPYPGKAHLYPENTEVDHAELIGRLCEYDGWALSTDSPNLRAVLDLCPTEAAVAAWVKPNGMPVACGHIGHWWEPVIYSPARLLSRGSVPDWHKAAPQSKQTNKTMIGSKPESFAYWLFDLLGADPVDDLVDYYPGTGVISEAWLGWGRQIRIPFIPRPSALKTDRVTRGVTALPQLPFTDRPTRSGHSLEGTAVNGPIPVGQEAGSRDG